VPDCEKAYAAPVADLVRAEDGPDDAATGKFVVREPDEWEGQDEGGEQLCERYCQKSANGVASP